MTKVKSQYEAGRSEVVSAALVHVAAGATAFIGAHPGFSTPVRNGAGDLQLTVLEDLTAGSILPSCGYYVLATAETLGVYCAVVRTSGTSLQVLAYLNDGTPTDCDVNVTVLRMGRAGETAVLAAARVNSVPGTPVFIGAHPGFADTITDGGVGILTLQLQDTTPTSNPLTSKSVVVLATSETATLFCAAVRASSSTITVRMLTDGGVATDGVFDVVVLAV